MTERHDAIILILTQNPNRWNGTCILPQPYMQNKIKRRILPHWNLCISPNTRTEIKLTRLWLKLAPHTKLSACRPAFYVLPASAGLVTCGFGNVGGWEVLAHLPPLFHVKRLTPAPQPPQIAYYLLSPWQGLPERAPAVSTTLNMRILINIFHLIGMYSVI